MSLHLCVLASGSSGNATLIWNEKTALLIDCGRSKQFIEESLKSVGCDIATLKGILITHGHGDHINSGTIILARHQHVPIYIHEETYQIVLQKETCKRMALLDRELIHHHTTEGFSIGDFQIQPFSTFHNGGFAGRSFGFSITCAGDGKIARKIGFLTDTGKVDERMIGALADSHVLILEANHDPELVHSSDRHFLNKQWVLSDFGHLSNQANADAILQILQRSKNARTLRHIFMAHLSEQHNTPRRALSQIQEKLGRRNLEHIELIPTFHRTKSVVLDLD
jgi:phosphoribosyl 1,2-cyclic phosphodiesterase